MRNKSILTKAMRRLMLMVLLVTQVLMGTSSAFADTVTGSITFDSSVWGTTNKQFDNGSTQTWTNYLTLTLNSASSGENCRIIGGYLDLYYQSTLVITAPTGCTITGMTINGSNDGGTPSTTPGSLTSEPGSTSYTWTGSASSVTISTDAGERDSYDFQSIVVNYETSLDAMASTTTNGAIYTFNQTPNPFLGASLYAKTITAGDQEMYFDAFGSDDPMIMQDLVDSSFYLHMPAQSRLRLQRSDSSSDIYITKAEFTFVSGSPSISPDGGTYNSSTHTWTGQESQIIFLFNEEADIQLIESEAGLLYSLAITSEGGGSVSFTASSGSGTVEANNSNTFKVKDGEEVMLTFTPSSDAYKVVAATVNGTNVFDALTTDGTYTIPSVTGDLTVYGGFDIAVKNGDVLTEAIDGVEWTYTVTGDGTCNLGGYVPTGDNIPAVPTSTVAENIEIPSTINGYVVNGITVQGFYGCSGLTGTLRIPESVTTIGDQAFQGTNFSGSLTLPTGLTDLNSYAFYNLRELTGDLVIPEGVTVLPAYAFFNCQGFTSLTLPAGVTKLWTRCFGQMYGLTQITCNAPTPPEISADNVFSNYDIPLFVPEGSVNAYKAAAYWSNFTKIYAIGTVLDHTLTVACGTNGSISGKVLDFTGTSTEEFQVASGAVMPVSVPDGYSVELTFTPTTGYYLSSVMRDGVEDIVSFVEDGKITLTSLTSDMSLNTTFSRMEMFLQIDSQTDFGSVNWQVTDVLAGDVITNGMVKNAVDDIPVPYGSTVRLTFTYDQTQYTLSQLTRNGANILSEVNENTYTITNYATNDTIAVGFVQLVNEPYVVLDGTNLTFYYDRQKRQRGGMDINNSFIDVNSSSPYGTATTAVFDASFADYRPMSTAYWFQCCFSLTNITGMENLKTDNVTDMTLMFDGCYSLMNLDLSGFNTATVTSMHYMFEGCSGLTSIDVSNFNTANVMNMQGMFIGCSKLTTIYAGNGWSTSKVENGGYMFTDCTSLVGGMGTVYDANHVDYTYAHIDGGLSNPGYFTDKNAPQPYVVLSDNNSLVRFYYDDQKSSRGGKDYESWRTNRIEHNLAKEVNDVVVTLSDNVVASSQSIVVDLAQQGFTNQQSLKDVSITLIDGTTIRFYNYEGSNAPTFYSAGNGIRFYAKNYMTINSSVNHPIAKVVLTCDSYNGTAYVGNEQLYGSADGYALTIKNDYESGSGGTQLRVKTIEIFYAQDDLTREVKKVVFDESFANCTTLTSTNGLFRGLSNLESISGIENLKTDNVTDMSDMFYACSSLTSLDLRGLKTANVTDMHTMFFWCNSLTSLNVSSFNTANVQDMYGMFSACSGLTSLDLHNFDVSNVENMQGMFGTCSNLTSLDLSGFNTANVKIVANMFMNCSNLMSLDISSFDVSNVLYPDYMFSGCTSLTSLDLSSFNTANAKSMNEMFSACSALKTIYVGSAWSTAEVVSAVNMFNGCTSLVGGNGTAFDAEHTDATYAHIDGGTSNPGYFTDIADKDKVNEAYAALDGTTLTFYYDKQKTERNGMTVERFNSANMRPWHASRDSITTVTFDASFANYRPTATAFWFNEFGALKTLNGLDNLNTSEVTYMDGMFGNCSKLKTIYINNNWDLSKVTSSVSMFNGCTNLIGGQWSDYRSAWTTATYARIDGGTAAPGYFTSWADTAAVVPVTASRNMYELTLTCPTPNVAIWYTIMPDSIPFPTGAAYSWYSGPITLDCDCKVLFYAERPSGIQSITSNYTFKMTDVQTVESPVFAWSADELTMTTGTEGATIYYTLTDAAAGTSTPTPTQYTAPITVTSDVLIEAYAEKEGMARSMTTVLDYPYTAWMQLITAIDSAQNVYVSADGNDNVTVGQRDSLMNYISIAQGMYIARTDSAAAINQMTTELVTMTETIRQAVEAVAEPYAVLSENNTVLTFYFDKQKENRGGRDLEWINWDNNWSHVAPNIIQAEFDPSFAQCASITHTNQWFCNLDKLTTIKGLEYLNTSNVNDMTDMFFGCKSLTSLNLSSFNTSNVVRMHGMFYRCPGLTKLDLSGFNTANVTDMSEMFRECSGLTKLDLSGFNTASVTDMSEMFRECSGLTKLDLSGFNTVNVTDMNNMFWQCSGLTSLDLSRFSTENVERFDWMFAECQSLESLDISSFNTSRATTIAGLFFNCYLLANIDVSHFNTSSVTDMQNLFGNCQSLTQIDVRNFDTSKVTNMNYMFGGTALADIDVSNFNTQNVEIMRWMFAGMPNLVRLDLSNFNTSKVTDIRGMFASVGTLNTIFVSDRWNMDAVVLGDSIFWYCTNLVGGMGTTYDANHVDHTYAHIDGGPANPGYLTLALAMGDANGDGSVNIADAVATVTNILGQPTEGNFYKYAADMNNDSVIDIFDVTMIVNAALAANTPAPAITRSGIEAVPAEAVQLMADANHIYMGIDQAQQYTAFQFDMDLPEGTELLGIRLLGDTDHQLSFVKRDENRYRVVALSMGNEVFRSANGHLIQLQVSHTAGENSVKMSNALFVTPAGKTVTGIGECLNANMAKDDSIYNLRGEKLGTSKQQLSKGIYIINHKKVIIK